MPRTTIKSRVTSLLHQPVRESRTAAHVSLVLNEQGGGGRGRPRSIQLMVDGHLTDAGKIYERLKGTQLSTPVPFAGEPFLVGNNQWINVTGQGRKKLSTFIRGKERLTKWGRTWYRQNPEEYIVHAPLQITYKRKNGTLYEAPPETLPLEWRTNTHPENAAFYTEMLDCVQENCPICKRPSANIGSKCCATRRLVIGRLIGSVSRSGLMAP